MYQRKSSRSTVSSDINIFVQINILVESRHKNKHIYKVRQVPWFVCLHKFKDKSGHCFGIFTCSLEETQSGSGGGGNGPLDGTKFRPYGVKPRANTPFAAAK